MKRVKKNFLSVVTLLIFLSLAVGSKVNKIHYGAFNTNNSVEDTADNRNYLVKNDGSKIFGKTIEWDAGLLVKNEIIIDGKSYDIKNIKGYRSDDIFYGRLKKEYIKRIIHGKINVYQKTSLVTSTTDIGAGVTTYDSYTKTEHYGQRGESGPMEPIAGQKDIIKFVQDCPLAVSKADLSNKKMRRAIINDSNYLNDIFNIYNNNCQPID